MVSGVVLVVVGVEVEAGLGVGVGVVRGKRIRHLPAGLSLLSLVLRLFLLSLGW